MQDHERTLNDRGGEAAALMGRHMRAKKYGPALVLCSTSARTRETLELLLVELKASPEIRYEASLYLTEWPKLLDAVRAVPDATSPLMLVGHNPGMEQLAAALIAPAKSAAGKALAETLSEKFPTGALAVIDFRGRDWKSVRPGSGTLKNFIRPKDLL